MKMFMKQEKNIEFYYWDKLTGNISKLYAIYFEHKL